MSIDPIQVDELQKLQTLVAGAVGDKSARKKLIKSPDQALQQAGVTLPPGVTVTVHENTDTEIHLVIPVSQPLVFIEPGVCLPFHFV